MYSIYICWMVKAIIFCFLINRCSVCEMTKVFHQSPQPYSRKEFLRLDIKTICPKIAAHVVGSILSYFQQSNVILHIPTEGIRGVGGIEEEGCASCIKTFKEQNGSLFQSGYMYPILLPFGLHCGTQRLTCYETCLGINPTNKLSQYVLVTAPTLTRTLEVLQKTLSYHSKESFFCQKILAVHP